GPGSKAWSLTFTPTYQNKLLFVRAEISYVKASSTTPGFVFGQNFDSTSQSRVMLETGILF
ncbi:MAG: porin, partial [Rhodanobacter sp.]